MGKSPTKPNVIREATPSLKLEPLLCSPSGFGLTTASPLQRAICRIADGIPLGDLAKDPNVVAAVGDISKLPKGVLPKEICIVSGIRVGKSLLASAIGYRCSQICDISHLGPGEVPRVSLLSLTTDLATVIHGLLRGHVLARPLLRSTLVTDPSSEALQIRHPSGFTVEILVTAGKRAGSSLCARWSAGAVFDEAPRMVGTEDAVVNFDDCRAAVLGRLLPGAQLVYIGSPWAPWGPIYDIVMQSWGHPTEDMVVIKAPAHVMNPVYWTPAKIAKLRDYAPDVARTDIDAEFLEPATAMYSSSDLESATRSAPLDISPESGEIYVAAMDPATRGNAWTLVIATETRGVTRVCAARQWQGSRHVPLSPNQVMSEIASICHRYGIKSVHSDMHSIDAISDIAGRYDLMVTPDVMTQTSRNELYENLKVKLADGRIELAPVPELLDDLKKVKKRVTSRGSSIELQRTSDGRHCDYASALVLAVAKATAKPVAARGRFGCWTQANDWDFEPQPDYPDLVSAR